MNIPVIVQYVAYTATSHPRNLYRDSGIHDFEPMGAFIQSHVISEFCSWNAIEIERRQYIQLM